MTAWTDDTDPFGTLAHVLDGIVLPELSLDLYDRRGNVSVTLPWVRNAIRATGLSEWFEERIAERKKEIKLTTKAGCPRAITVEAILVAWFMGKFARNSFLHTETARFLLSTLTDQQRVDLGVPLVRRDPTAPKMLPDRRGRLDKDAVGKRISRLSKQMDDLINPSRYNQARSRIATVDKETLLRTDVTPADLADAQARLDWVTLQITSLPIKMMPRWLRRQYKGDGCVDDTPIRLASSKENPERIAWDITGGLYIRTKPTSDRDARKARSGTVVRGNKGGKAGKGGKAETKIKVLSPSYHAHDASLVIACDATPGKRQYFPTMPLGFTLHAASTDPAGNSKRVFDLLATTGIAKRHMGGDRLYPHQDPAKFHLPLLEAGWGPVFDFRIDTLGRQGYAPGGLLLVEGQFHCPMTPESAIEATRDLRNGIIDHATYKARMDIRASHRLHVKGKEDHNGTSRCECPAAGNSPKVKCPLRQDSLQPHIITQPDGSRGDTRLLVQLLPTRLKDAADDETRADAESKARAAGADDAKVETAGKAAVKAATSTDDVIPRICQGTVSVKRETLVKHRQPQIYGSSDHKNILRAVRNSQEGFHGFAKDDAQEAMGAPGLRRKRGLPAQSLFAAIGFAVAAIRKIVSFLSHMQEDEHGDFYVPRKPRPGSEHLALGEGGGYQDDDDDNWPADWLEDIPDAA